MGESTPRSQKSNVVAVIPASAKRVRGSPATAVGLGWIPRCARLAGMTGRSPLPSRMLCSESRAQARRSRTCACVSSSCRWSRLEVLELRLQGIALALDGRQPLPQAPLLGSALPRAALACPCPCSGRAAAGADLLLALVARRRAIAMYPLLPSAAASGAVPLTRPTIGGGPGSVNKRRGDRQPFGNPSVGQVFTSVPNPKFAHSPRQPDLRTSGST